MATVSGVVFKLGKLAIKLRSPDMNDTQDILLGVQRHFDMSGRQHTFTPTINTNRLLILVFRPLAREKFLELRDFVIATAGKTITYIDFNAVTWLGVISTETITSVTEGVCRDTVTVQFEGTIVQ